METTDLVQQAQDREYTNFDNTAKEILAQKVAQSLDQLGYFDRLSQAQNETETETDDSDDSDE